MAKQVTVDGACLIRLGVGGGGSLVDLGYSVNGVDVIEDVFMGDVPGDQNGGDLGQPIDIQYFGQIDRVRIELSNFDPAVFDLVQPRLNGGAGFGLISTPGTLIGAGGFGYRLLLLPFSGLRIRNYYLAIPRQPVQRNKGTRYTRPVLEFECHGTQISNQVVLFDENIS